MNNLYAVAFTYLDDRGIYILHVGTMDVSKNISAEEVKSDILQYAKQKYSGFREYAANVDIVSLEVIQRCI